jgi:phosphoribosyl 1,2-cyclic phosphodiesterase
MSLRLCVLGSGSRGNSIYAASGETAVLIDAGLSGKQTRLRLERIGVDISNIDAICVSHEHSDHIAGLRVLNKRFEIKLYANSGTITAVSGDPKNSALEWNVFTTGSKFVIGDLEIEPFSISHDAYEPVGYTVSADGIKVGIATDLGMITTLARERLRGCRALVIEANHDTKLLRNSRRPWSLKQRIMGRNGHLSNESAAEAVIECADENLARVYLAHLSDECNRPDLAKKVVSGLLKRAGLGHIEVYSTYPDKESECWES